MLKEVCKMIEALPYKDEEEHKKYLESLPDEERKQCEEYDRQYEESEKKRIAEEEENERLEKLFSKSIIRNAVEQDICSVSSSTLELPKEAEILLPYSFYECREIMAARIHENIKVCTKETFHETDDILLTNPAYKKENGLMINTHLGILLYADDDLNEVVIPEGVVEIAPYAFTGCSMKSIRLPDSLEKIGQYCFNSCPDLETITIPGKVKNIERNCFNACDKLRTVILSEGLQKIGICSFCSDNLEKCILPSTLKEIGDRAFFGCTKLDEVDYKDNIKLGYEVFEGCVLLEGKIPPVKHFYDENV